MFRIDSEHRFTNMFKQMGVQLSGIVTNAEESMKIDEVLHKTFIEVQFLSTKPVLNAVSSTETNLQYLHKFLGE